MSPENAFLIYLTVGCSSAVRYRIGERLLLCIGFFFFFKSEELLRKEDVSCSLHSVFCGEQYEVNCSLFLTKKQGTERIPLHCGDGSNQAGLPVFPFAFLVFLSNV